MCVTYTDWCWPSNGIPDSRPQVLGTYLGGDPTFQHACYDAAATAMCPQDNAAAILAKLRLKRTGDHGCPH